MTESILYKLLDTTSFKLRLNEFLPKYTLISELLSHNNIPYESWVPTADLDLGDIEMTFGINCKFQDIYLLAYLLKEFGLKSICPTKDDDQLIVVGTYLHHVENMGKYILAYPMDISTFLSIDPKSDTQDVISTLFDTNVLNLEDFADYAEYEENYSNHIYEKWDEDHFDYDRANFDALTDGFEGDYYDWRDSGGNFDTLRDSLGY
jgi:hypothetical protein